MALNKKKKEDDDDGYSTRLDRVKKKYEETTDSRWWKPRSGKNYVRILGPWGPAADGCFYFTAALHYGFTIGGRDAAIPCSQSVNPPRGDCKVCEFVSLLNSAGDEDFANLSKRLRYRRKYWVNLVTSDKEFNHSKKVFMYGGNKKFIDKIIAAMDNDDYGDVTHPTSGRDLVISKEGEGFTGTRYDYQFRATAKPLTTVNWRTKMFQLDKEVIEWMNDQEIADAIRRQYGDAAREVGLELPKKGAVAKKKPKPEEDEDEEGTEDEDDEKPAKKGKVSDSEEDGDEKEEDGDEDGEDEDDDEDDGEE